jgi:hypothetical protein
LPHLKPLSRRESNPLLQPGGKLRAPRHPSKIAAYPRLFHPAQAGLVDLVDLHGLVGRWAGCHAVPLGPAYDTGPRSAWRSVGTPQAAALSCEFAE